jgi:hypothetical protein
MTIKSPAHFLPAASGFPCLALGAAALLLGGCGTGPDNMSNTANAAAGGAVVETIEDPDALRDADNAAAASLPTDAWVGLWTGPEGLFLDIQPSPDGKPGHYAIANKDNLDRQADYQGIGEGSTIRFVRDGRDHAIRPGTGADTGFKYLADKKECLIVIPNREGYCR